MQGFSGFWEGWYGVPEYKHSRGSLPVSSCEAGQASRTGAILIKGRLIRGFAVQETM